MMRIFLPLKRRGSECARTALALILCTATALEPTVVIAQERTSAAPQQHAIDTYVAEAARRFGIPQHWIRAVMEVESAGNPRAVSPAGAMGLMQIMPGTWAELRAAYRLGDDPFDPRDNILAGAPICDRCMIGSGRPAFSRPIMPGLRATRITSIPGASCRVKPAITSPF